MKRLERQILRSLLAGEKTFWHLITEQDGDLPAYVSLLNNWVNAGIVEANEGRMRLTSQGCEKAREAKLIPFRRVVCPRCTGRGLVSEDELFTEVSRRFKEIAADRPHAIAEFDQGYVEPKVTVARVQMLYRCGDLEGQSLFILGDDDLTSIAAALTSLPQEIAVLEIDDRVLEFIDKQISRHGLKNISLHKFDVQQPLAGQFHGRYDHFVTDPVETLPGIELFLSRSAQALKGPGCSGYFGLTHLEASRQKWHRIQRLILDMGFAITDIVRDFHSYVLEKESFVEKDYPLVTSASFPLGSPDRNWYTSDLFRIEAVRELRPAQPGQASMGREMYFDDESYVTLP